MHNSKGVTQRANPRLLLVDDDRDLCHLVTQYLEPEGFTLSVVHTGGEGIRTAMLANLQIFTLRRVFLTAPSKRTRDNEDQGGNMKRSILLNFNQIAWTLSFFAIRMAILLL